MSVSSPVKPCEKQAPPSGERSASGRYFAPLARDLLHTYPSLCPVLGDLTIREYQTSTLGRRVTVELPCGRVLDSGPHKDIDNAYAYVLDQLTDEIRAEKRRRDELAFYQESPPLSEAFGEAVAALAKGA